MKKIASLLLALTLCVGCCLSFAGCGKSTDFTVGVCQLMKHPALDSASEGFKAAVEAELAKAGKTVNVDIQVPGEASMCATVAKTFVAKKMDLIMGNATDAVLAAANATSEIPVLGTSVTDYENAFEGNIPANVTGMSDAVPFAEQAEMMIETLNLVEGEQVGVLYCINESNSKFQYEAVKALFEEKGIVVVAYTFSDVSELQALTTKMAGECKAVYIPSDNTVSANEKTVAAVCNEKNIPIYTSYGGDICYASLAIDYYELGYQTGVMAAQILLGEKTVADLPIATLKPEVSYNQELCEALNIAIAE